MDLQALWRSDHYGETMSVMSLFGLDMALGGDEEQ